MAGTVGHKVLAGQKKIELDKKTVVRIVCGKNHINIYFIYCIMFSFYVYPIIQILSLLNRLMSSYQYSTCLLVLMLMLLE